MSKFSIRGISVWKPIRPIFNRVSAILHSKCRDSMSVRIAKIAPLFSKRDIVSKSALEDSVKLKGSTIYIVRSAKSIN